MGLIKMKSAVTIWALNGGTTGEISVIDAARKAKESGFDALEASFYKDGDISMNSRFQDIRTISEKLKENELVLSSLSTLLLNDISLISEDSHERKLAFSICEKMIDIASELELQTVSISPGKISPYTDYWDAWKISEEQIYKLSCIAEKAGLILCAENVWHGFLLGPVEFAQYCDNINSPALAVCLDLGNTLLNSYPQHWINCLNHRIKKLHFTDFRKRRGTIYEFVDPGNGDADWNDILINLNSTDYEGFGAIEAFPKSGMGDHERLTGLYQCINKIMEEFKSDREGIDSISTP